MRSALAADVRGSTGYEDDSVHALTTYDDGGGAALYAGGYFTAAGGVAANRIARWDGSRCPPAVVVHRQNFDSGDGFLAKWGCPPPVSITSVTPLPQPGAGGIRK